MADSKKAEYEIDSYSVSVRLGRTDLYFTITIPDYSSYIASTLYDIIGIELDNAGVNTKGSSNNTHLGVFSFRTELEEVANNRTAFDLATSVVEAVQERVRDGMDIEAALQAVGGVNPAAKAFKRAFSGFLQVDPDTENVIAREELNADGLAAATYNDKLRVMLGKCLLDAKVPKDMIAATIERIVREIGKIKQPPEMGQGRK
jgi:hypothetical protein